MRNAQDRDAFTRDTRRQTMAPSSDQRTTTDDHVIVEAQVRGYGSSPAQQDEI